MGQMVGVVERKSTTPGVVRFELNRSLSGMGHERFGSVVEAIGSKPSAARGGAYSCRLWQTPALMNRVATCPLIQIKASRADFQ